jgi:uncharacterized membrane protein YbaN (DUF454 family)
VLRVLFAAAGLLLVGLGVLGILLPGLPATPFLLLAAYCFARSFPRLHTWLTTHPWFGPYIRGARSGWRIPRAQAMQTIAVLWISMAVTAAAVRSLPLAGLLLVIAGGVTIFLERRSRVTPAVETTRMERMRQLLFAVLLMGLAGTGGELALTGHYEDFWQKAPLVLLAAALVVSFVVALSPAAWAVLLMRLLMGLCILAGMLGTYFHYESNAEFVTEITPGLSGFELLSAALTRPMPPPLAPGTMIMLGLLGLICCYGIRGPRTSRAQGE